MFEPDVNWGVALALQVPSDIVERDVSHRCIVVDLEIAADRVAAVMLPPISIGLALLCTCRLPLTCGAADRALLRHGSGEVLDLQIAVDRHGRERAARTDGEGARSGNLNIAADVADCRDGGTPPFWVRLPSSAQAR